MFKERANPFAKETPTSKDPINPGPRVKATALNSSLVTPPGYLRISKKIVLGIRFAVLAVDYPKQPF